ncbi:MAG: SDR family oxidoreductase [Acidobacteria bacterium]|nr:SDR family oxidoreductase [Acidobacteriota bacterium]
MPEAFALPEFQFREKSLEEKVVLLAGGSGGLGAAAAFLLAREGARLLIGYRSNRPRAQLLQKALRDLGARIELIEGDLNQAGVIEEYIRRAVTLGPLSGVVIFAGDPARATASEASTAEAEAERMQHSWKMNFLGPYQLARRAAQEMVAQGTAGNIVLIATMQAIAPFEKSVPYAAPKAALVHAARVLAYEFGGANNIGINIISPGVTTAGMAAASVASGKYERFLQTGVIPRYGRAEDIARAVRLLLEPDSYITGQVIIVDGGLTLRR